MPAPSVSISLPVTPMSPHRPNDVLQSGCSVVNSTRTSYTVYEATSVNTITQTPPGIITVYYDDEGRLSTLGMRTVYEVAVYQTALENNYVTAITQCGG